MLEELIIAGFGGQGIMFMGQLLAYAGMIEDKHVAWIPSYGPEVRGGTANCAVTLADREISSPIVTEPTSVIVMNQPSLEKFEPALKPGGLLVVNSSLAAGKPSRGDLRIVKIAANNLAEEKLGNAKVPNLILLGAYIELTKVVLLDSVVASLKKVLPESRRQLIPLNRRALELGAEIVRN